MAIEIKFDKTHKCSIKQGTIDNIKEIFNCYKSFIEKPYKQELAEQEAKYEKTSNIELNEDVPTAVDLMNELVDTSKTEEQEERDNKVNYVVACFRKMSYYSPMSYDKYNIENRNCINKIIDNHYELFNDYVAEYHKDNKEYFPIAQTPKTFIEKIDKIQNYFIRKQQVKQGTIQKVNEMIQKNMEQNQNESSPF